MAAIVSLHMMATEGALPGKFTINAEGDKVQFSKGNLQYKPSTQTWRFAENQYDKCTDYDNEHVSADYDEFVDLFGWGTGDAPVKLTTADGAYSTFTDWGTNAISNGGNEANLWRTLTKSEWAYLLVGRKNAKNLFFLAKVDGVAGLVLLPDDWVEPHYTGTDVNEAIKYAYSILYQASDEMEEDLRMSFDGEKYYCEGREGVFYNGFEMNDFPSNKLAAWQLLEDAGAVFLPYTPYRSLQGSDIEVKSYYDQQEQGYYWTSTKSSTNEALVMFFGHNQANPQVVRHKSFGYSVRLVQPYEEPAPAPESKDLTGRFSVAADKQVIFSQGNLQYLCSKSRWQFAGNQYDMVGEGNANIALTYKGLIDLFGWGTGNNPTENSKQNSSYGSFTDWTTNTIVNGGDETWLTLSADEWDYLLNSRPNSASKQGQAVVNDVKGYILLPDNWTCPAGISFSAIPNNYTTNIYTLDQWTQMEDAGAVFLPAAGSRYGTDINAIEAGNGYYWTGDLAEDEDMAKAVTFTAYTRLNISSGTYSMGYSIRPARYVNAEGIESPSLQGRSGEASKVIRNGQLLIEKNGKLYNALGTEVK